MKFSIKDFFSKCDEIRRKLRIWSHLLKKSLIEKFIFCAVVPVPDVAKLVSDFKLKSELFDSHFATQCLSVKNAIMLPDLKYRTDKRLESFTTNEDGNYKKF